MTKILRHDLPADLETPISASLKLGIHQKDYSFLLESVEDGSTRGRYSVIGFDPDLIWYSQNGKAYIQKADKIEEQKSAVLDSLSSFIQKARIDKMDSDLPPIAIGVYGYMGYDMVRFMEELPQAPLDRFQLPDALFIRPSRILLFDSVQDQMILLVIERDSIGHDANGQTAQAKMEEMKQALSRGLIYPSHHMPALDVKPLSNIKKADYLAKVQKVIDYIHAGDIYQAVISQRFEIDFPLPAFSFYRALRMVNPSPYLYFMNFGSFELAGSSPETLVRNFDRIITIRPIAGTIARPSKKDNMTDKDKAQILLQDPKERAEHLMLLDLGRNDVGRVARLGSVEVKDSFRPQWTSHLIHIASHIEGILDDKHDALSAMIAGFPAGTVSGAPKIRAMEIIDELEDEKRATYAGALGYFSSNGDMDSCITLRTALIKDQKLYVQTGGGVVADSIPEKEYQESVDKAKALHQAASIAHSFAPLPHSRQQERE